MDMSVVVSQMGILVLLMLVGVVCAKLGVTGPQFNKSVNGVVMNVLLVGTILSSALTSSQDMSGGKVMELIGLSVLMLVVSALAGVLTPKLLRIRGDDAGVAFFLVFLMNSVFVAFPVIEAVYGPDGVLYASMSNIPFNMLAYSVGVGAVRGGHERLELKKMITPPLVATVVAVVITLTGLRLPAILTQGITVLGRATVPMSMLVIGTSLGGVSFRTAMSDWRVYILSIIRLVVCPVLTWLVLSLFVRDPMTLGVFTILSSAPGPMLATVFAIQYGKNETFASQGVFISTILSALTMPLMIWLLL